MGGGQNTYNPLKNKGRNKKIIIVIIFLVLIIVSISFAVFSPSINLLGRRNIKISKCELDINFKESDELMLVSKYPISTRQALEGDYKPKTVTITNNSTCDTAYYKLTIKDLINSSINKDVIQYHVVDKQNTMTYKLGDIYKDNNIDGNDYRYLYRYASDESETNTNSAIRFAGDVNGDGKITTEDYDLVLNYWDGKIISFPAGTPLEEKTTTKEILDVNPDSFLIENYLEKGQTHEYEIMMWISNTATNTDLYENGDTTKPIEYKYALNVKSSDEKLFTSMTASEFALANVGKNGLEEVTHEIDDTLQVDSNFKKEYRYRGGSVKNYITFNNELWRIIGIIPTEDTDGNIENRFKIIKDISRETHYWNETEDTTTNSYNNWTTATLNTYLNTTYYNGLSNVAKSMIGTTKYYLGGYSTSEIIADTMWQYERKKTNGSDCTINDYRVQIGTECYFYKTNQIMQNDASKKIALMYASDYGYALSKECTNNLSDPYDSENCSKNSNWLDTTAASVWLLSPTSIHYGYAFSVAPGGFVIGQAGLGDVDLNQWMVIPVLTLTSNVKIFGGIGASSDPYQLSID